MRIRRNKDERIKVMHVDLNTHHLSPYIQSIYYCQAISLSKEEKMFYETTLVNLVHKNPDFLGFKWVLKALDPDSYSRYNVIKIQKDLIVGTDSHRLHIYYTKEEHPPGIFRPLIKQRHKIVLEKIKDKSFLDWEHVLPTEQEIEKEIKIARIDSTGYTELVRQMDQDKTLDFNYFMDLESDMINISIISEDQYGRVRGILFQNSDSTKKAVIMSVKM